jgi:hypothetical protein
MKPTIRDVITILLTTINPLRSGTAHITLIEFKIDNHRIMASGNASYMRKADYTDGR